MKKEERLEMSGKGRNIGVGGRMLHLCVAISYGRGVVICVPYVKLTGGVFGSLVEKYFPAAAYHHTKVFVQDNCPAQNAKVVMEAHTGERFPDLPTDYRCQSGSERN